MQALIPFLPQQSVEYISSLYDDSFIIQISNPRKTKLADFRPSLKKHIPHKITINRDLNPYSFLITLIHEIAHLHTWNDHQQNVKPHGIEWKMKYQHLTLPLLNNTIFPDDILRALAAFIGNPSATSCTDINLYAVLKKYDVGFDENIVYLDNLPQNTTFSINNRAFIKGEKARKRYKCKELKSGKFYMVHPLAEVELVKTNE